MTPSLLAAVAGVVLAALVVTAALSDRRRVRGALLLGGLGVLWLLVNKPMEGVTLLAVTSRDGLTAADLAGLAAVGLAGWRLWAIWRERSAGVADHHP